MEVLYAIKYKFINLYLIGENLLGFISSIQYSTEVHFNFIDDLSIRNKLN